MKNDFRIPNLGPCEFDSTLDSPLFVDEDDGILLDATAAGCRQCKGEPVLLEKSGPRRKIYFDAARCRAAMVTCGGLCPGLNDVTRAVTMVLWYRYQVKNILGLRYGYEGLVSSFNHEPIILTPEVVEDIHKNGGTILGSSRGPQDIGRMVEFLVENRINILFTIGGDGTQRGALAITREIARLGLKISVVGIPKTIDNDISCTERTFGFETAMAMSQLPITCAHMESKGARNGIGLVKLMGRESGFVATHAALASSDVNLVLIPEVPFSLKKVMAFLEHRFERKSHAVVLVAEGAGQDLLNATGTDPSGNRKLGDIGLFLKSTITEHFRNRQPGVSVKYIDPSYIIRSAPASPDDSVFCFMLGEYAVHAAMAGRTGMIIGLWNGHFVHVPMEEAVAARKRVDPAGLLWQSVLDNTGQPADLS